MKMFNMFSHLILWCINLFVLVGEDRDTFFQKKTCIRVFEDASLK